MIWKKLDDALNFLARIICLLAFLFCAYAVYDGYLVFNAASDNSILAYKPDEKGEPPEIGEIDGSVAWLTIDDTSIDYPIMQGIDNAEYINKDPEGNYSISGSIFLDCRNSSDFTDPYSLVYGHHMEHGYMFGSLDKFLDQDFLEEHRTGTLTVKGKIYDIDIFATVEAPAEEPIIFAPTESEYPIDFIKKNATVIINPVPEGDRLIGMSTCKYPETSDRTILFGYLRERTASDEESN